MQLAPLLLSLTAFTIVQSEASGQWVSIGDEAAVAVVINLEVSGNAVTGTVREGEADPRQIFEGQIVGTVLSFTTEGLFNGQPVTVIWKGNFTDNDLTITRSIQLPNGSELGRAGKVLRLRRQNRN